MIKDKICLIIACVGICMAGCAAGSNTANANNPEYNIVVDAGSSGSRVYVYQINRMANSSQIANIFESSNKIPLASFAPNPESAGSVNINPLLMDAINILKANYNVMPNQVTANVLGTAGMRLIPESSQMAIYQNVATAIKNDGLILGKTETISGQQEGLYSWVDVNYLSGSFTSTDSVGIIEVGGASTQMVFNTSDVANPNVIILKINHKTYAIYSVSFLGLGLDQARDEMNLISNHDSCYIKGYNSGAISGDFNLNLCKNNYRSILSKPEFDGLGKIPTIPRYSTQAFIGTNGLYYTLNFWGIESNPTQELLRSNINATCYKNYSFLQNLYPNSFKLYNQCANATYMDVLLYNTLNIGNNHLTATNKIANTTLTWTLGYVFLQSM